MHNKDNSHQHNKCLIALTNGAGSSPHRPLSSTGLKPSFGARIRDPESLVRFSHGSGCWLCTLVPAVCLLLSGLKGVVALSGSKGWAAEAERTLARREETALAPWQVWVGPFPLILIRQPAPCP